MAAEAVEIRAWSAIGQDQFVQRVLKSARGETAGAVVDWEQVDPIYKKDSGTVDKFDDALQRR